MDRVANIGEYFKQLRGDKSLGQVQIATGISKSYICLIEQGKRTPSPDILLKLSTAYEVDYMELFCLVHYDDIEPESLLLRRLIKGMTERQRKHLMKILRNYFPDFFTDDTDENSPLCDENCFNCIFDDCKLPSNRIKADPNLKDLFQLDTNEKKDRRRVYDKERNKAKATK